LRRAAALPGIETAHYLRAFRVSATHQGALRSQVTPEECDRATDRE
jgi:hypothetical protein